MKPKILLSKCCGADLFLESNETHVWGQCSQCGAHEREMTVTELMAKVRQFIDEPNDSDEPQGI